MMKAIRQILLIAAVTGIAAGVADAQTDTLSNVPYDNVRNWSRSTSDINQISGERLELRSTGDLMERLTGLLPGLEVRQLTGEGWANGSFTSRVLSNNQHSVYFRGSNQIRCIIDDVCVPFETMRLDPEQIESVTILSNLVDQTRFGPLASNGAVYIRTRRGGYNRPFTMSATIESGVSIADRIPEWVNGVEYAQLNNQARIAAGYTTLYDDEALRRYAAGNPYDLRYPNVNYRDFMLKQAVPTNRIAYNVSGGTNRMKYNMSITGYNVGHLVPYSQGDYSQVNVSGSVAVMVGKYIEVSGNVLSNMSFLRTGMSSWSDWRSVPAIAFPLILDSSSDKALTIYGSSKLFPDNPYAKMVEGGFKITRRRSGLFTAAVDVDMPWITKGLGLRASVTAMSGFHAVIGKNDDYLAYLWSPEKEISEYELSTTHKGKVKSSRSTFETATSTTFNLNTRLSYIRNFGRHYVDAGAAFVLENSSQSSDAYHQKQLYTVVDASYSYDGRYNLEMAVQYAGSARYARGHRFAWFPAAGVSWVPSNEPFLKGVKWIDNIKIYGQASLSGQASSVFGAPYLYRADYSFANGMTYGPVAEQQSWFGDEHWVSQTTTINRLANRELTWPKIFQYVIGIDIDLFDTFSLKASAYWHRTIGSIGKRTNGLVDVFGVPGLSSYANYGSIGTLGSDGAISLYHRFDNGFYISAGCSANYGYSTYLKIYEDDELNETQINVGNPTDSYRGWVCEGKYETLDQLNSIPSYAHGVQLGDLIYSDLNKSGTITTADRKILGNTAPRLRYSLTFDVEYKGWELHAVGTGRAFYVIPMTNEYFWNGWGDGNYSAFVRDNLGGAYPRLSYEKSSNNFIASSFWLHDGSYFKVQDVELAYNFIMKSEKMALDRIRLSLKAQDVLTFTDVEYVDPENIDAGVTSYPFMKTFTVGVKLIF